MQILLLYLEGEINPGYFNFAGNGDEILMSL